MEFNPLPDLMNTGFIIIGTGLQQQTLGSENMQILEFFCFFLTRSLQDDGLWSVLNRGQQLLKTFQILVEFI